MGHNFPVHYFLVNFYHILESVNIMFWRVWKKSDIFVLKEIYLIEIKLETISPGRLLKSQFSSFICVHYFDSAPCMHSSRASQRLG